MGKHDQQFRESLQALGYDISDENGVIMAIVSEDQYKDPMTHIGINNAAVRSGYRGSYGLRPKRSITDV